MLSVTPLNVAIQFYAMPPIEPNNTTHRRISLQVLFIVLLVHAGVCRLQIILRNVYMSRMQTMRRLQALKSTSCRVVLTDRSVATNRLNKATTRTARRLATGRSLAVRSQTPAADKRNRQQSCSWAVTKNSRFNLAHIHLPNSSNTPARRQTARSYKYFYKQSGKSEKIERIQYWQTNFKNSEP